MQQELLESKPVGRVQIVRTFKKIIETRNINHMTHALYDFLIQHCGFIAHYSIHGFKDTYSTPRQFADVFIRHFDPAHPYCHWNMSWTNGEPGIWPDDREKEYQEGSLITRADIKRVFQRIVAMHKEAIERELTINERKARYLLYLNLKKEFESR